MKERRKYFAVHYDDKERAKEFGLRWDADKESWYHPIPSVLTEEQLTELEDMADYHAEKQEEYNDMLENFDNDY